MVCLILSFNSYSSTKSSSWIGRVISSKLLYYPRQSTDSVQSISNYQWHFFTELEQKHLKICVGTQKTLKMKNGAEGIRLPDLKLFYKAVVIKTVWYWHKSRNFRSMEQDRKPRNKPMSLRSINLWQRREVYTMLERQVSSTNGPGKNEQPHVKNEIRSFFNSIVKISSRWIKDLNVSVDTIKL